MFTGFAERDFEAYAPRKWKSNAFTRERLEVKQKLLALGRELGGALRSSDGSPLDCEASAENPALWNHHQVDAQHLFFSRSEGARRELDGIMDRQKPLAALIDNQTPQRNHIFLDVTVDHFGVGVSIKLHPDAQVDRQNLERKCEDFFERQRLIGFIRALPEGSNAGWMPGAPAQPRVDVASDGPRDVEPIGSFDEGSLQRTLARFAAGGGWFYVGWRVPRDDPSVGSPAFADFVRQSLEALLPLFHFMAWTRDNDFVSMREVLRQEKQARRQKNLVRNDRVRIVRGMLAGQTGLVQDLDGKGSLKLLVGKMAVKVDAEDVVKA
jgi:hypothetical protein